MQEPPPLSPRLTRLRREVAAAADPAPLIEAFWAEVDSSGTPLVEPTDEPSGYWVSFVWRVGTDDRDVAEPRQPVMVMGGPAVWWEIPDNVLGVLAGTDVAARSYLVPSSHRGRYILSPGDPLTPLPRAGTEESVRRAERFRPDPRNRTPLVLTADPADPLSHTAEYSTFALPDAAERRWADRRPDVPAGRLQEHRLASDRLGNTRRVWTYQPEAATLVDPLLLVVLDGRDWVDWVPLTTTVDNLIAERLLPPVVMVLPEAMDTATRYAELTVNPTFTDFLVEDLLPFAAAHLPLPTDPRRVAVHGKSFGGLAALAAGLEHPDVFGTVLSQSGSFWWSGWDRSDPELLVKRVHDTPRQGALQHLRVSLDIGELEGDAMLDSHEHMAQALTDRGYRLRTHRYHGGHDINCWISELPAALRWWAGPLAG